MCICVCKRRREKEWKSCAIKNYGYKQVEGAEGKEYHLPGEKVYGTAFRGRENPRFRGLSEIVKKKESIPTVQVVDGEGVIEK